MTAEEMQEDENVQKIEEMLRNDNADLDGFELESVSRQLVNGYVYLFTFTNEDGAQIIYNIFVSRSGVIDVQESAV